MIRLHNNNTIPNKITLETKRTKGMGTSKFLMKPIRKKAKILQQLAKIAKKIKK